MKKIITLLFVLAFTSTSFATRILTIRNSSPYTKNFYALEMIFSDPVTTTPPGPYLHAIVGHYVQLNPGEFITFSNFHSTDINEFNYCPAPSSEYKMIRNPEPRHPLTPLIPIFPYLPTSTFQWHIPNNDIWPIIEFKAVKCNEVPQLPSSLGPRAMFRGFKVANQGSAPKEGVDYLIAKGQDYMHRYYDNTVEGGGRMFQIRETFLQLPSSANPTLEIQEIIFL
ncbi:hypothetical protein [Myroides sp. TSA_177.3]|uniref:hypothetical protein n=1 Tax=Myroides sp. TSA_177.3 TaxID=3415650 RepID=UPI0040462B3E